ncbi:MAG: BolA family transcriptional regulator, partial [Rhodobacteraceae bacterium]|nr:BolA family transcriptional regulator [Paracoccaceae bacterium]
MSLAEQITARLTQTFSPLQLDVVNESHRHAGHSGDDGSGESHFKVIIRAPALAAMSRVE